MMLGVANVSPYHELLDGPGGTLAGLAVTNYPSCRGLLAGSLGIGGRAEWRGRAAGGERRRPGACHVRCVP